MPQLSIIIISYNTCDLTLECLENLRNVLSEVDYDVWLVDNASSDDTLAQVRKKFPSTRVIANEQNAGFGTANNMAMKQAQGLYYLLLNSDAFPKPGAVQEMLAYLDTHADIDLVGPRVLNRDGSVQISVNPYYSPWNEFLNYSGLKRVLHSHKGNSPAAPASPYWMSGCCLLLRRGVHEKTSGFDPAYFFYGEDADLQMRMRKLGMRTAYLDSPQVVHYQGSSGAKQRLRFSLWYAAMVDLFIFRHYGWRGIAFYRFSVVAWCVRKLCYFGMMAASGRLNHFALRFHYFLLTHTFSSSQKLQRSIPEN